MVPATLLERLGLGETVDERMPGPGSNRGYRHGTIFETFMLMFHEGAECLEDVRHRHGECALAGLMGFRSLPCAATPGNGLRRVGRDRASRDVLQEASRRVLEAALQERDRVTLDIDASGGACEEEDREAHRPGPAGRHADGGTHRRDRPGGAEKGHTARTGRPGAAGAGGARHAGPGTGQGRSAATSAGPVYPAAGSAPVRWSWPRVPSPAASSA